MHFKLIWSGRDAVMERPENVGLDGALARLKKTGTHTFTVIDASSMSDQERFAIYLGEAVRASRSRYKVGRAFGSQEHKGEDLGRAVPALIAYASDADTRGADVFPHEAKDGRIVTITDGLSMFGFK